MAITRDINPLIIFGSSRSDGNTFSAIKQIFQDENEAEIIDLNNLQFTEFDYNHQNENDDFLPLAQKMISTNPIILATPVYWYMPSAIMKKFIDRFSDFTTTKKDLGRKLKGKDLYIISSYHVHPEGKEGFERIFQQICDYMSMNYRGCYFYYSGENSDLKNSNQSRAQDFYHKLKNGEKIDENH